MKKIVLSLCAALLLMAVRSVRAETVLHTNEYGSLTAVIDAIPQNAGSVTILIDGDLSGEQDADLRIPADRGITEISLLPAPEAGKAVMNDVTRICAGGIPLTVGKGIRMDNASIYGGECVSGAESALESSSLKIGGAVGYVFGGGLAEDGGSSAVAETNVVIEEGGLVYFEVFGGGHAFGSGSRAFTETANTVLSGTTDYLLGAGFAEAGGQSECTRTAVTVAETGTVEVGLFGGGSAADAGSTSSADNTLTQLYGTAHWAFPGDFAFGGGQTHLNSAGRLEILPSGSASEVYLGSFSSDPGSDAFMNTAEVMNCGTAEVMFRQSQSVDGGKAETMITAVFPCKTEEDPAG